MCPENEDSRSHKNLCTNVHSSLTGNSPKLETTQLYFTEWMINQTMKSPYYVILFCNKKKKQRETIYTHTTAWINLQRIILDERSWCQKVTYHKILFIEHSWNDKIIETGALSGCQSEREGVGGRWVVLRRQQEGPCEMCHIVTGSMIRSGGWPLARCPGTGSSWGLFLDCRSTFSSWAHVVYSSGSLVEYGDRAHRISL